MQFDLTRLEKQAEKKAKNDAQEQGQEMTFELQARTPQPRPYTLNNF
jgi:hypothetical protein